VNKFYSIVVVLVIVSACDVNPSERNNAGNALYAQGQYEGALAAYQAAQVALPDSPEAYYNAASAYSQNGELDKAIEALHQALKTPNSDFKAHAYYNLGNIYFQMLRFDDAVTAYQQALLLNPTDEDARHNLELAIRRLIVPSPTPISPTEQPTDLGENDATPTSELSPQSSGIATVTPDTSTSQPDTLSSTPAASDLTPTISIDDAEGILDAVQQSQQLLPNQSLSSTLSAANSNKDW